MSDITLEQLEPRHFVGIRRSVPVSELGAYFHEVLPRMHGWLKERQIEPASMPMAMWWAMDMQAGIADCQAGFFVHQPVQADGEITPGVTQSGDALVVTNTGPYDSVGQAWMTVFQKAAELGRKPGAGWEIYLDDPGDTPADQLRTKIHLPLQ